MNIFDLFKQIETGNKPQGNITHIIAGLGNPGDKYTGTRHNIGFVAIDALADKLGVKIDRARFKALVGEAELGGKRVLLMKPQTFMNLSGEAVREASDFYKIPHENIIIIYDDVSLPVGKLRVRVKGSAGGHNGIKSIIEHLGGDDFPRIKIGVGQKPFPEFDLADWVLGKIPDGDRDNMKKAINEAVECPEYIIKGEAQKAMGLYN